MEFDKRTLLAMVLIGLILIFIQTDFYKNNFLPPQPEAIQEQPETSPLSQSEKPEAEDKNSEQEPAAAVTTPVLEPVQQKTLKVEQLNAQGKEVRVETRLYTAVFSTRGAGILSMRLKKYPGPDGQPVELVGQDNNSNLTVSFPSQQDTIDTGELVFAVDRESLKLSDRRPAQDVLFTLDLGDGKKLRKKYTFYNDKYSIDLKIEFRNMERLIEGFAYGLHWKSGMNTTEPDLKLDMQSAAAYALQGDSEKFTIKDEPKQELFDNTTQWVAIRTKYFTSAVVPKSKQGKSVLFKGMPVNIGQAEPLKKYAFDLKMAFDQKSVSSDDFILYLGPLDYDIVTSYNVGLEKVMDLGWAPFRPFAKFILWSFTLLHEVIPNYGFVIILFSILIKVVLYPLTKKSYQSMKQMQTLQPVMSEMNEKYKNDPQKKQQEMMKLYKEYGINPLGGCIPMVLQMPLLIALFNVFRSTIELRGASFIWWITDLSRPDTIAHLPFTLPLYGNQVNILPLFMGITMFIQQKMSIKDPKQKAMVYFMPLFLTLLFNSFPSGLNLYYALFNLFTIMQEKLIPYKVKTLDDLKKEAATKTKKRRAKYDYKKRAY